MLSPGSSPSTRNGLENPDAALVGFSAVIGGGKQEQNCVQNTCGTSWCILEHQDQVLGLKSGFSQHVMRREGVIGFVLKLLCILDDSPVQGQTEALFFLKAVHFANGETKHRSLMIQLYGAGGGTGSSSSCAEGSSGYFGFFASGLCFY